MAARVVIVGGGFAAIEAAAAVRALAGELAAVTVVAPNAQLESRPMSVTALFEPSQTAPIALAALAERVSCTLRRGALERVDADRHVLRLAGGDELPYEALLIATGAIRQPAFPGAITFAGAQDAPAVAEAVAAPGHVAFVSPTPSTWSLPLYELALLSAQQHPEASVAVVTVEATPLWVFGVEAGEAVRELFVRHGIALLTGERVLAAADGELELDDAAPVSADRAVALPQLAGPDLAGLPSDDAGFLVVDAHCAVRGVADVYAAGDVTAFPLKQGGLAAQQADAAAAAIAAKLGAAVEPRPFAPVLRGLLLTGGAPLYIRSDGAHGSSHRLAHTVVSSEALWWPPAKVAGRYLAPLLRGDDASEPLHDLLEAPPEPENAGELALMLAQEDADRGDYAAALRVLDTAQALNGTLPVEWQRMRTLWQARAQWSA